MPTFRNAARQAALNAALDAIEADFPDGRSMTQLKAELNERLPGPQPCNDTLLRAVRAHGLSINGAREAMPRGNARHQWTGGVTPADRTCLRCKMTERLARQMVVSGRLQPCMGPPSKPDRRAMAVLMVMRGEPTPVEELRAELGHPWWFQDAYKKLIRHQLVEPTTCGGVERVQLTSIGEWGLDVHWRPGLTNDPDETDADQ